MASIARTVAYWGGNSLYVNLTSRCSAGCTFCLRGFTWEVFGENHRLPPSSEPETDEIIRSLERALYQDVPDEVVIVGLGEPTLRFETVPAVLDWLRTRGLPTRLGTDGHGQLLNSGRDVVAELALAGLEAASVSLNAQDEEAHDMLCRPMFRKAFRAATGFIRESVAAGIEVTATVVADPEVDLVAAEAPGCALGARFPVRPLICVSVAALAQSGSMIPGPVRS